jgi:hypothetical protein
MRDLPSSWNEWVGQQGRAWCTTSNGEGRIQAGGASGKYVLMTGSEHHGVTDCGVLRGGIIALLQPARKPVRHLGKRRPRLWVARRARREQQAQRQRQSGRQREAAAEDGDAVDDGGGGQSRPGGGAGGHLREEDAKAVNIGRLLDSSGLVGG